MPSFLVPDDLRAFLQSVVADLDAADGPRLIDAEDAFQDSCGYGGRIAGGAYRFYYLTHDGVHRWTIVLSEHEIRAIADGLQIEAAGQRSEIAPSHHRLPSGDPLLVWGAYNDDALRVRGLDDLVAALDRLRLEALDAPRVLRLWSPRDDQLVAALWRDRCALYVIDSVFGYATSAGDARRTDAFEVLDHDGVPLVVPWSDCVDWPVACRALIRFAAHGELGGEIVVEGRIPSQLLMHGELDRAAVLAARAEPASDLASSSLGGSPAAAVPAAVPEGEDATAPVDRAPVGIVELTAWGRRLIDLLCARELVELDGGPGGPGIDEIGYHLSGLLQAHGDEAEYVLATAEWLANEISAIGGVRRLFATAGDLQLALRRSRAQP